MNKITVTEGVRMIVENDARQTYPHECCGFLYGKEENGKRTITHAQVVDNTREENRERRFEISPLDYMRAEEHAEQNNLTLLGVYHSHPDHPAIPSEYDLKRALPYFSYIIVSVKKGKIADFYSWRLNDQGKFEQEQVLFKEELNLKNIITTN